MYLKKNSIFKYFLPALCICDGYRKFENYKLIRFLYVPVEKYITSVLTLFSKNFNRFSQEYKGDSQDEINLNRLLTQMSMRNH